MRIYFPATSDGLRQLATGGELTAADRELTGFAVTPGLRAYYEAGDSDDDLEELEYAAMLDAARGSLRLLDAYPQTARRRVVVAADVPDGDVQIRDDLERGVVRVSGPVPLARVASVHVDDAEAEATVAAAAGAIVAADLDSADAADRVDDAEGFELSWYANQEIASLLDEL